MLRAMAAASFALISCHALARAAAPRPEFEAASIKLNRSGESLGGRFTASNIPLQYLVTAAYGIKNFQLSGAPPWFLSEHHDIEAKAAGDPSVDAMLAMFQTLFEDRLQLKFHHETKELPEDRLAAAPCHFMILRGHNLAAMYDINLDYTPDEDQFRAFTAGTNLPPPPSIDPNDPSLFTALQEQLGLKLESGKGPVEILVMDHIERPSEN
jgi:hypothetical protein